MKISLYALLFALVPYVHPMSSSSSTDQPSSSSSSNQHSSSYIIIKNNTPFDLWFAFNAGGSFEKIGESADGKKEAYKRDKSDKSVKSIFCDIIHSGVYAKTSDFTQGQFLTVKVASDEASLTKSNEVLTIDIYKPEVAKNIAVLSLEYRQDFGLDFIVKNKDSNFCYLCLKPFQKNDNTFKLAPCGHCFHIGCYNPVQKQRAYAEKSQNCPCCEQLIDIDEIQEIVIE